MQDAARKNSAPRNAEKPNGLTNTTRPTTKNTDPWRATTNRKVRKEQHRMPKPRDLHHRKNKPAGSRHGGDAGRIDFEYRGQRPMFAMSVAKVVAPRKVKAAKRPAFPGVSAGITAGIHRRYHRRCSYRDSNALFSRFQRRPFSATAARSGPCRCRSPKTTCPQSTRRRAFPGVIAGVTTGTRMTPFSRYSATSISPEFGFPQRFR